MFHVPSYRLRAENIFNFRERNWGDDLTENVTRMLSVGEKYNIRIQSITVTNPEKIDYYELKQTTYKVLKIDLVVGDKEINLKYDIPWLHDNHFFVSGNYKVPIYQVFDYPMIKREDTVKLRTNIQSFMIKDLSGMKRKKFNYQISMFGQKFPFANLVVAFFGDDESRNKFQLGPDNEPLPNVAFDPDLNFLRKDVEMVLKNTALIPDHRLTEFFPRKPDSDIIDDMLIMNSIDIFSAKFMSKPSIVEELIEGIRVKQIDDMDYSRKRIRFSEYIIYVHLCKDFYNLMMTVKKGRRVKFSNNPKVIVSNINQSDIVQYDFSLNPLSEISLITRTSLSGPGGFEKANVPPDLRDLHPSTYAILDPADTADRDGCGTIQYFVPDIELDSNGKMIPSLNKKIINSIAVTHVPFLMNDDATRLQMASSQQRHSIMLERFDVPLIQSGTEGLYTDQTSFMFKAKRAGKVIYKDHDIIIVKYDNKMCEAFNIGYRKLFLSVADFYNTYYEVGETFNKDDIITESNYLKNGRLTIGKNLLTCVAVWYGYNYEDGIVISKKVVDDDEFTSVHYVDLSFEIPPNKILENLNSDYSDYKPLPKLFEKLKIGDVCAKLRTVHSEGFHDVVFEPITENTTDEECMITDIKIYANKWDKTFPQYDKFIQGLIDSQKQSRVTLIDKLTSHLTQDELDRFLAQMEYGKTEKSKTNYKVKGDSIEGVLIEITAMYRRKLTIGDKLGNRHGNKGVVSAIVPEEKMPKMPDGTPAQIVINPLGVISRMNIGQLYELHLAMSFMDLKKKIKAMSESGSQYSDIKHYVIEYIKIVDKTEGRYFTSQVETYLNSVTVEEFVEKLSDFYLIQPPYESITWDDLKNAMDYTGTAFEYQAFDPVSNVYFENELAFGYQYFLKMNHIAKDKINYRGVGPYSSKTAQPLAGKTRKGGQRLGEMEIWAVIGHGSEKNLKEFITVKSDSIKLRNEFISKKMCNDDILLDSEDDSMSQSLRLLQSNLKSVGLTYDLNDDDDFMPNNDVVTP